MNWELYLNEFDTILNNPNPPAPYNNPDYLEYTKLNNARLRRWMKTNPILDTTKEVISKITTDQHWIVITEPWCGDAAHIVPILQQMAALNHHIDFSLQLRDTDSEIDKYLTHGTKSIPILVVRNDKGKDLFHWGPRPAHIQEVYNELKANNADFEVIKESLQKFYNADKAVTIQNEVVALFKSYLS